MLVDPFLVYFSLFYLSFPFVTEKDVKMLKMIIWNSDCVQSTHSMVKIHNSNETKIATKLTFVIWCNFLVLFSA